MKSKMLFLSVAVVAVGLFVLPQAVSMFAGQHSWYDPKDQGIPCIKCHWIEYEEMRGMTDESGHVPHMYMNGSPTTYYFDCEECHNVSMDISEHHHNETVVHTPAHAATTLSCLDCHGGELAGAGGPWDDIPMHQLMDKYDDKYGHRMPCNKCHREDWDDPDESFIEHVDDELTNDRAAHRSFFLAMQDEDTALSDANEACLGCHSRTGVNITWTRNQYVSYQVTCDKNGYNVSWNQSDDLGTNESIFGSSSGWDW